MEKLFLIYQNKTNQYIYKSTLITCPIGFDIALTNVEATLKQRRYESSFRSKLGSSFQSKRQWAFEEGLLWKIISKSYLI